MLLSEKDQDTTVRSFHAWSNEFSEQFLDTLGCFGFCRHEDLITAPPSDDWKIERKRGLPFAYRRRGEPILYNPCFAVLFRGRCVVSFRVTVYTISSTYSVEWNNLLIPRIRDYLFLPLLKDRLPEFLPSVLEHFLIGM